MADNCAADPSRECIGLSKYSHLETEVAELRKKMDDMTELVNDVKIRVAVRDEQYRTILEKIDNMNTMMTQLKTELSTLEAKPAKKWENLVQTILGTLAGAIVTYICFRLGIVGG